MALSCRWVIGGWHQEANEQEIQYNEHRALMIPVPGLIFSKLPGAFIFSPKD